MEIAITKGVKVSVEAIYQPGYSKPLLNEFVHAYRIRIYNGRSHSIQVLERNWYIWDSNLSERKVEGMGVVGKQPHIAPGEEYEYVSGCPLRTEMGYMQGHYMVTDEESQELFKIHVPRFYLLVPFKLN